MKNPLMSGSPPIPRPNPQPPQPARALSFTNALAMPSQAPQMSQPQMPAPSHQQTVAAIRHFMAIIDELQALEKDPSLGRADCKMQIIDGFSKLVAARMISSGTAVAQLTRIPADPLGQRKWMKQMLQQTIAAQNNVLDHHVATHPATLDWAQESQHQPGSMDDHMRTMDGLSQSYNQTGT